MFAVIYRSYIKPGLEDKYQKLWNQVTNYFIEHRGAIGSSLHKTEDGIWLVYSRWPDKTRRDASWSSDSSVKDMRINNLYKLASHLARTFERTSFEKTLT